MVNNRRGRRRDTRWNSDAAAVADGKRLAYLDLFRGVAILQIVMLHAGRALFNKGYGEPIPDNHVAFATVDILFRNATLYFTLISGIIFAHVFANRDFVAFLKSRALNVAAPYVAVSTALTVLLSVRGRSASVSDAADIAGQVLYNVYSGGAWNHLWYIPVILALYLLTPTLLAIARAPQARLVAILIAISPLIISRTGTTVTMAMLVYFAGAYILGLQIGLNPEGALNRLQRHIPALAAAAASTTAALYFCYLSGREFIGPVSLRESLFYVQKLSLGALMLIALRAWSRRPGRIRDMFLGFAASTAFAIYFIHAPALRPIASVIGGLSPDEPSVATLAGSIALASAAGLLVSWAALFGARAVFGRRSRLVIGA